MAVLQFIIDSGFIGWCIMFTGLCSLALVAERVNALYFKYGMNVEAFTTKIFALVTTNKVDEAIVTCGQMENKPLAKAVKTILEKSDMDDDAIFQAQDIALAETTPLFTKRVHYLSMLANVATLLGLLGTIHGLILSFQAVASADPSQKQALLAQGISVSMYTTALGLAVAIPLMVAYSFIISRQNTMVEQLMEKSSKLVEIITGGQMVSMSRKTVFPDNLNADGVASHQSSARPPSGNVRAS